MLTSQFYWELKEFIKNKIFWLKWSDELQKMINKVINIDDCM
jgi:hypothetical protein